MNILGCLLRRSLGRAGVRGRWPLQMANLGALTRKISRPPAQGGFETRLYR